MHASRSQRRRARRRTSPARDVIPFHAGEWCGLSVAEREALTGIECSVADADPGFALRLSSARWGRLRSWLLSPGGTAAGAGLLVVGVGGATVSGWFVVAVGVGSIPAVVDVAESRRRHRRAVTVLRGTDQPHGS